MSWPVPQLQFELLKVSTEITVFGWVVFIRENCRIEYVKTTGSTGYYNNSCT